jgi:hypothetical protein
MQPQDECSTVYSPVKLASVVLPDILCCVLAYITITMQEGKINRYGRQNLALLSQNQQTESGSHAELICVVCVSKQRGFSAHMLRGVAENLLSLSIYIYIYIYIYI